eukprot:gene23503-biopygen10351
MVTEYIAFESWCFNSAVVMNCVVPVKMSNMSNSTTNRVKCRLKQGPCRHSDQESHDTMNISSTYDLGQFDMSAGATKFHAPSAPFPLCSPRGTGPLHSGKCIIILRTRFDDLDGSGPLVMTVVASRPAPGWDHRRACSSSCRAAHTNNCW